MINYSNETDMGHLLAGLSHRELIDLIQFGGNIESATQLTDTITMIHDKQLLDMHHYTVWQSAKTKKWCTYIQDSETGKRKLIRYNSEIGLKKALCEHYRKIANNPTVRQVFTEWIASKLEFKEISKASADRYETDFDRFFKESGFEKVRIKDIDKNNLTEFIKKQIVLHGLSEKTFGNLKTILRGIMKYALEKEYTDFSITYFFGDLSIGRNAFQKRVVDPDQEVLKEDEIPLVKEYLLKRGTIRDLGVLLELQTGVRVGELSTLL